MHINKPILCVDFDGVIHSYTSGWQGVEVIPDPPVTGAIRWLFRAQEHWDVQIYSSRSKDTAGIKAMMHWLQYWSRLEGIVLDIGFAAEKPAAFLTIDDRAICFDGVWANLDPQNLLNFKPWNRREVGATGKFPDGSIHEDDEGELRMAIGRDSLTGLIHFNFGKPVAFLALEPSQARVMAEILIEHANGEES